MNKKALLKLADHIDEAGDEKFDLSYWARHLLPGVPVGGCDYGGCDYDGVNRGHTVVDVGHVCGSTGCVAGWQNSLANAKILKKLGVKMTDFIDPDTHKIKVPKEISAQLRYLDDQRAAAEDLGLSARQHMELFTPDKHSVTCWSRSMGAYFTDGGLYARKPLDGEDVYDVPRFDPFKAKSQDAAKLLRDLAFGRVDFISEPMNVASTPEA